MLHSLLGRSGGRLTAPVEGDRCSSMLQGIRRLLQKQLRWLEESRISSMLMVEHVLNDRSDGSAEILSIVSLIVFIALISSGAVIARKSHSTRDSTNYLKPPAIIPQPVKLELKDGSFHIDSLTRIVGSPADKQTRAVAESLAGRLRTATGFPLPVIA